MTVKIPKDSEAGAIMLATMPQKQVRTFLKALKSVPPSLRPTELTESVARKITDISSDKLFKLLEFLVGVAYGLRHQQDDKKKSTFIEDVSSAVANLAEKELGARNSQQIKSIISESIAGQDTLGLTAKAFDVFLSYPNVFTECSVYSDVRPLFSEDVLLKPTATVITHTLKIQHRSKQGSSDFYVTMDLADLKSLKSAIDRALVKSKSLVNFANKSGLRIIAQ